MTLRDCPKHLFMVQFQVNRCWPSCQFSEWGWTFLLTLNLACRYMKQSWWLNVKMNLGTMVSQQLSQVVVTFVLYGWYYFMSLSHVLGVSKGGTILPSPVQCHPQHILHPCMALRQSVSEATWTWREHPHCLLNNTHKNCCCRWGKTTGVTAAGQTLHFEKISAWYNQK